jgi:hypothetical protein
VEFELDFTSSNAIKSHVLIDFVAEWTPVPGLKNEEQTTQLGWDDYSNDTKF